MKNLKTIEKIKKTKSEKQMERHFKGIANHRRIQILLLVAARKTLSLEEISEAIQGNIKTVSEHVRRLVQAGLINKQYQGRRVIHTLSPYGKIFYNFVTTFSHS